MAQVFDNEVQLEIDDGVALLTFIATDGQFEWGTPRAEHRLNHVTVGALLTALDAIEAAGDKVNVVVLSNEGKFWSNGADLRFADKGGADLQKLWNERMDQLLPRVLTFPLPTVAAIRGHCCAAGGQFSCCFDYRCMATDQGVFFIPGVDLGIVYAPFNIELMKAKMDTELQREVILMNSKRWVGEELHEKGFVDIAAPKDELLGKALELAKSLKPKGMGPARAALGGIKKNVYKQVLDAIGVKGAPSGKRAEGHVYAPPPPIAKKSKL